MKEHRLCQGDPQLDGFMPKRVLDLSVADDGLFAFADGAPIRLTESANIISGRTYACLSHRWGLPGETLQTTQATYEARCDRIDHRDLGDIFADAVRICLRMGVRYLWIDSLAILQDSEQDWNVESKLMAKIYSGAQFTLALHYSPSTVMTSASIETQNHLLSDSKGAPPIYARVQIPHLWDWDVETQVHFPLTTRGWVYQERLLSRRVVHFSSREMSFECAEGQRCECGWGQRASVLLKSKAEHGKALNSSQPLHNGWWLWWRMVREFTQLDLTRASDRLPALQGCADQIKDKLQDNYLFEMWEDAYWKVLCGPYTLLVGFNADLQDHRTSPRGRGLPCKDA
jgi:hypothetical protein